MFFLPLFVLTFVSTRLSAGTDPQINKETFFGNNIIHCIDVQFSDTINRSNKGGTYELDIERFVESGNTFLSIEKYTNAISDFKYALNFAFQAGDSARIASLHNLIGLVLDRQYLYDEALVHYLQALSISKEAKAQIENISALNYIGGIYYKQNQYENSLDYYVQSLSLSRRINYKRGVAAALNNVGEIYRLQGQIENAQSNYIAALKINKSMGNREWAALNYENIGKTYFSLGRYTEALEYYINSMETHAPESPLLAGLYISVGEVYAVQGRISSALQFFIKSYNLAEPNGDWKSLKNASHHLSTIYSGQKDFENAFHYRDKEAFAQDTLNAIISNYRLLGLQAIHNISERERQLELKNKELAVLSQRESNVKSQRTILILTVLFVVLSAIVLVFWLRYKIQTAKQVAAKSEKLRIAEQQMRKVMLSASETEKKCINEQLQFRHKQLIALGQSLASKNVLLQDISEKLKEVEDSGMDKINEGLTLIMRKIKQEMVSDKDSKLFQRMLEELNEQFFVSLRAKYPDLTQRELQLLALIRLNLSAKEIASLQNTSSKAVEMAKYRLRKRLKIESNEAFRDIIST